MKAAVIVFPGSNCDRDVAYALELVAGKKPTMVWHQDTALPDVDVVVVPGGFSYGDYLRSGAMAARSPIMQAVVKHAEKGGKVLGICNGFQILTEAGLLPGALMRNRGLTFICKTVGLTVENTATPFTKAYKKGEEIAVPIAHHDGCYYADSDTLKALNDNGQVVFRYTDNPNGSADNIAGIINKTGNVLGLMPHPERVSDPATGGIDGKRLFESLLG